MQFVRPDFVTRTSVLEPTAEGYQPDEAAQNVATQFTRIYGPTVWDWKEKKGRQVMGHLGQTAPPRGYAAGWRPRQQMAAGLFTNPANLPRGMRLVYGRSPKTGVMTAPPVPAGTPVYTRQGTMAVTGAVGADTNDEAIAAIARAFARGQSVRIRDAHGRVAIAHPGDAADKHAFFENVINKARALAEKVFGKRPKLRKAAGVPGPMTAPPPAGFRVIRDTNGQQATVIRDPRMAPTVPARPSQIAPAKKATPAAPVAIVRSPGAPGFNRVAAAAGKILQNTPGALPNRSIWLPPYQGALKQDAPAANAASVLATNLTRGPQSVTRPAVANAMNAFRNTGRYF